MVQKIVQAHVIPSNHDFRAKIINIGHIQGFCLLNLPIFFIQTCLKIPKAIFFNLKTKLYKKKYPGTF